MEVDTEVGVYNRALNLIGEKSNISSPTEQSRQAEVCRQWYEIVRNQVLEAAPWPEATQIKRLALLAQQSDNEWNVGDPQPKYIYAYALPSDYIRAQYLSDYSPFEIVYSGTTKQLQTNAPEAILRYTFKQENVAAWSSSLLMAVIYALAGFISQPLTGKTSQTKELLQRANDFILQARVNAANTSMQQIEAVPEWIAARGYNYSKTTQFFYPMGSMLSGV